MWGNGGLKGSQGRGAHGSVQPLTAHCMLCTSCAPFLTLSFPTYVLKDVDRMHSYSLNLRFWAQKVIGSISSTATVSKPQKQWLKTTQIYYLRALDRGQKAKMCGQGRVPLEVPGEFCSLPLPASREHLLRGNCILSASVSTCFSDSVLLPPDEDPCEHWITWGTLPSQGL